MTTYVDARFPLPDEFSASDVVLLTCNAAAAAVRADGCAISAVANHGMFLVTATEDPYARLERTQQFHSAGPIVDAWSTAQPVAIPALDEHSAKWPELCHLARRVDVVSMLSVPITTALAVIGTLTCYSRTARTWTATDLSQVRRIAAHARRRDEQDSESARQSAAARPGYACGDSVKAALAILSRERHISEGAAARLLTRYAAHAGLSPADVAHAVVRRSSAENVERIHDLEQPF